MRPKFQNTSLSIAALFAAQLYADVASAAPPFNQVGRIGQGGNFLVTYFFSDRELTNLIGRCQTASPCTVAYCEGKRSRYREDEASSCDEPGDTLRGGRR